MYIPGELHIEVDWTRNGVFGDERTGNLLLNTSFEADTTSWSGLDCTITSDGDHARYGTRSLKQVSTSAVARPNTLQDSAIGGATAGFQFRLSAWGYATAAMVGRKLRLELSEQGGAQAQQTSVVEVTLTQVGWKRIDLARTIVQNDRTNLRCRILQGDGWQLGDIIWWDGVRLEFGGGLTDWDESEEDIVGKVLQGSYFTGRDDASYLTGKAGPGRLRLTLDNQDNRYSPFNSASPHAGELAPGAFIRVRDDSRVKWIGRVASIIPNTAGRVKTASLDAHGILAELAGHRIAPIVTGTGDRTGTLMIAALDDADAGFDTSGIEAGDVTTGPYGTDAAEADLIEELRKLEEAEFGFLFEDPATYRINFHSRTHRATMLTPLAVFADDSAEPLHFDALEEGDHLRNIFNRAIAAKSPWTNTPDAVVFTDPGPYPVSPGGTVEITAKPTIPIVAWSEATWEAASGADANPSVLNAGLAAETTGDTGEGTTNVLTLPTYNPGDAVLIIAGFRDSTASSFNVTTPAGWTRIASAGSTFDGTRMYTGAYIKKMTGAEGATLNFVATATVKMCGLAWAITGWDDYAGDGTFTSGINYFREQDLQDDITDDTEPPPIEGSGWGDVASLVFIAVNLSETQTLTSLPTGYSFGQDVETSGTGSDNSVLAGYRLNAGGDAEPEAIVWGGVVDKVHAVTLAIRGGLTRTDGAAGLDGPTLTIPYDDAVGGNPQIVEAIQFIAEALTEGDLQTAQADYLPTQDPITGVGVKSYRNAAEIFRNLEEADAYAELVVLHYGEAQPYLKGHFIANASQDLYDEFREREVGDRITVTADNTSAAGFGMGIDEDFIIEAIEVEILPLVGVTFHLSPAFLTDPFILDTSVLDGPQLLT